MFMSEVRIDSVELPHLSYGPRPETAVAGDREIQVRDLLEPARRVKARSQFVSKRLVVNKTICAGRADRLLVETLSIELAAFDPRDLSAHECSAVLEILRAVFSPDGNLFAMIRKRRQMPGSLLGWSFVAPRRLGKGTIELVFRLLNLRRRGP